MLWITRKAEKGKTRDVTGQAEKSETRDLTLLFCNVCKNLSHEESLMPPYIWMKDLTESAQNGCLSCSALLRILKHFFPNPIRFPKSFLVFKSYYRDGERYDIDLEVGEWNAIIGLSIAPGKAPPSDYGRDVL